MKNERMSGVLCPLSCLPSPYGIGCLGKEAYSFIDYLSESHVKVWQMLPFTLTSYGDSPYQSPSSTGLSYYYIDLRILEEKGLLKKEEYDSIDFGTNPNKVDYSKLFHNRVPVLEKAFSRFDRETPSFKAFVKEGTYHDFAFFMTLKNVNHYKAWYEWDKVYSYSKALEKKICFQLEDTYLFYLWTQYEFLDEFHKLRDYAHKKGLKLMGDIPLYVAYDSVEAYKYPELFLFDKEKKPTLVAGCPPDYFTPLGQLWGNPIYDWKEMEKNDFAWYKKRIQYNLSFFDYLRIDHFRGFSSYYTIKFGAPDAREGKWVKGPGMKLFKDLLTLPIIAEDLGDIDDDVRKLLKDTGYPGMKVLQFAFDGNLDNEHKPCNAIPHSVMYTGTHDNMPIHGHLKTLDKKGLKVYREDLKIQCETFDVPYHGTTLEDLTRTTCSLCYASDSYFAIIPLWDLLAKDEKARINFPSTTSDTNWSYRFIKEDFTEELQKFISSSVKKYDR